MFCLTIMMLNRCFYKCAAFPFAHVFAFTTADTCGNIGVRLRIAVCTAVTAVNPFAVATNLPLPMIIVVVAARAAATFDTLLIVSESNVAAKPVHGKITPSLEVVAHGRMHRKPAFGIIGGGSKMNHFRQQTALCANTAQTLRKRVCAVFTRTVWQKSLPRKRCATMRKPCANLAQTLRKH